MRKERETEISGGSIYGRNPHGKIFFLVNYFFDCMQDSILVYWQQ
jgi:hypothetical protein